MSTNSTDLALVPEQTATSVAAATLIGMKFVSEALLPGNVYSFRRATWATGNNNMRAANGKTPLENARGFIIDKPSEDEPFPEDYELLDAMDVLCQRGKAREVFIEHFDKDNKPNWVASWQLLECSLLVVCEGVPDERSMRDDLQCRWGIAYAPRRSVDTSGNMQSSEVHFTAFIKELMDAGIVVPGDTAYNGPFTFKFSSYIAPKALAVLKAHEYVLRFVNALRADAGEKETLPYYALALPVKVSTSTVTAGTGAKTKQVHYPVPAIPRLSRHDPEKAIAFLSRVAVSREQAEIIEENDRVAATSRWSVDFSKKLLSGNVVDEAVTPLPGGDDSSPPYTDDDIPESLR